MRNRKGASSAGMVLLVMVLVVAASVIAPAGAFAKTKTKLSASLSKTYVNYGSPATLTGTLKTSKGKAIKSQYVTLYRDSTRIGKYKTNGSGKVAVKVKYAAGAGWHFKYAGSKTYGSSSSSTKTTYPNWLVSVVFHGEKRSGGINLVSGQAYQWYVDAKAPTVDVTSANNVRVLYKKMGQTTTTDSNGTETTYYWWSETGTFTGPSSGGSGSDWWVQGQYYGSRTAYFKIW
jgi:hypothetical protein